MAVECIHCGNFVEEGAGVCAVCGGALSGRRRTPSFEDSGSLMKWSWNNLRNNWQEWFAFHPAEALIFKALLALLGVMFAVTVYLSISG